MKYKLSNELVHEIAESVDIKVYELKKEEIAEEIWDDAKGWLKAEYEGSYSDAFDRYINCEVISDMTFECLDGLNAMIYLSQQDHVRRILSNILVHYMTIEDPLTDVAEIEVDKVIDELFKTEEGLRVEDMAVEYAGELNIDYREYKNFLTEQEYNSLKASYISVVLRMASHYDLRSYELHR